MAVSLYQWQIQVAGDSFEQAYTFPQYILAARGYCLVGGEYVENRDLTAAFSFQNGGSCTDGVRLVSPDSSKYDTILYDTPNTNELPDDIALPGTMLLNDVESGHSLARVQNGFDTNQITDWFDCENPTPGMMNVIYVDLAITRLSVTRKTPDSIVYVSIHNLCTLPVYNFSATVDITSRNGLLACYVLTSVTADTATSLQFTTDRLLDTDLVTAVIHCNVDNNNSNNSKTCLTWVNESPIILNEVMFSPREQESEWIELYNRSDITVPLQTITINDASGGKIQADGMLYPHQYAVVAEETSSLAYLYPDIELALTHTATHWTSLNNTTETLAVQLADQEKGLDSLQYDGSDYLYGYSIERNNPYTEEQSIWQSSQSPYHGTPTMINSTVILTYDASVQFQYFERGSNLLHHLLIRNRGIINIPQITIKIYQRDCATAEITQVGSQIVELADSLCFTLSTESSNNRPSVFWYVLCSELDQNAENDTAFSFQNEGQSALVINEIMYRPSTGHAEWLELKRNSNYMPKVRLSLVLGSDSTCVDYKGQEYVLITGSTADSIDIISSYETQDCPIYLGLPSLSNEGETLALRDNYGNHYEAFIYPITKITQSGISLERIESFTAPITDNWEACISPAGATPGKRNSVESPIVTNQSRLIITPNPFSPYKHEITTIQCQLTVPVAALEATIYDLKGRTVRVLTNQTFVSGNCTLLWNGNDKAGKRVPIGIYLLDIKAVNESRKSVYHTTVKVIVAK